MRWLLLALGLPALGALSGFWLAGKESGDDRLVARINGVELSLADVKDRVDQLSLGDQIDVRRELNRFADSVIREELLFQYALHGPERDEIKAEIVRSLIRREVHDRIDIDQAAIETFYRQHIDEIRGEYLRARQIRLAGRQDCERLQPRLTSETAFIDAVRTHSLNRELAERDGDMGYLMRHFDLLGFESELFGLELRRPHLLENDDGCYLIWLSEYLDPPPPPLAEVSEQIRQRLRREREIELLQALLERASAATELERFSLEP